MSAYLKKSEQVVFCIIISPQDHKKGIQGDGANHNYLKETTHYDSLHKCLALSISPPVKKLNKRYDYLTTELDPKHYTLFVRLGPAFSPLRI